MWRRFVAIGDSTVEGLDDPVGDGTYRGWADRLAAKIDAAHPGLLYANLAVRGKRTGEVLAEQVPSALALAPDLVAVAAGVNDVLTPGQNLAATARDLDSMFGALAATGATVLTITMPDPVPVMPLARVLRRRLAALDAAIRRAAERHGVLVVDVAAHPVASDPRLWSDDRLHANSAGHERIAAAIAQALGLPGSDASWQDPLPVVPARPRSQVVLTEAAWLRRHFAPWVLRRLRGRPMGEGWRPKRPELSPAGGRQGPGQPPVRRS